MESMKERKKERKKGKKERKSVSQLDYVYRSDLLSITTSCRDT